MLTKKPIQIMDAGSRIFHDGMDGTGAAAVPKKNMNRRMKRSERRNKDRYKIRRKQLMDTLIEYNLMPDNEPERKALELIDPYYLRYQALERELTPHELGRAIFHINQRRGFKSNRKADSKEAEAGVMKSSISAFRQAMNEAGVRTAGEMLYFRKCADKGTRARRHGSSAKDLYDIYIDRDMIRDELNCIWEIQQQYLQNVITDKKLSKNIRYHT